MKTVSVRPTLADLYDTMCDKCLETLEQMRRNYRSDELQSASKQGQLLLPGFMRARDLALCAILSGCECGGVRGLLVPD